MTKLKIEDAKQRLMEACPGLYASMAADLGDDRKARAYESQ